MENFIYSINATLPVFIIIILGKIFYRIHLVDDHSVKALNKFVFYVSLPCLVFKDLGLAKFNQKFDFGFIGFCFVVTLVSILGVWALTELFMKNESEKGAFIQASYRSSAAILGMAFIDNMFGDAGLAPLMIIGAVPLYNIFAVIILTIKGENPDQKADIKGTLIAICKNPILIGIFVALPFTFLQPTLPTFFVKTVNNLAATASPLALIAIGASFEGRKAIKKIRPTAIATSIKLVLLASMFLPLAIWMGFRHQELVAILIMLASPATPSCYIMAKNTNNDATLTSSIIVLTTILSSVTLTTWIYLLKNLGFI